MKAGVCSVVFALLLGSIGVSLVPITACEPFVTEGSDFSCECRPPAPNTDCTLSWAPHVFTHAPRLLMINVRREDNGTQLTCQMDCGGVKTTTTHTLQVAYGPPEGGVIVSGPNSFTTNGSRSLTLTCETGDVNPEPLYTWKGILCDNGSNKKTCTFKPQPGEDGKDVECKVVNLKTDVPTIVSAVFSLNLTYPPPTAPILSGYTQPLKPEDCPLCKVIGGKPLVSSVNFSCSEDICPDFPDEIEGSIVISPLCNLSQTAIETQLRCKCSAVWEPEPELYALTTEDILEVINEYGSDETGSAESDKHIPHAMPIGVGATVAAVVVIIVVVIMAKRKRDHSVKTEESLYARPGPRRLEDITIYQGIVPETLRHLDDVQTMRESGIYQEAGTVPDYLALVNPAGETRDPGSSCPPTDGDGYLVPNPRPLPHLPV